MHKYGHALALDVIENTRLGKKVSKLRGVIMKVLITVLVCSCPNLNDMDSTGVFGARARNGSRPPGINPYDLAVNLDQLGRDIPDGHHIARFSTDNAPSRALASQVVAIELAATWLASLGRRLIVDGSVVKPSSARNYRSMEAPLVNQQTEKTSPTLQVSSWGSRPLTAAQLEYAALDAHAAVMVRHILSFPLPLFCHGTAWSAPSCTG